MLPTHSTKFSPSFTDMPMKRKCLVFLCILILVLWTICLKTREGGDDFSINERMERYEFLLKETREQVIDRLSMCHKTCLEWDPELPVIYVITPTYARPVQKAELTRLSHTLMLVKNLHWIVVEDAKSNTDLVKNLLVRSTLNYTLLNAATPDSYKRKSNEPNWQKPRGVEQRNTALRWLRAHKNLNSDKGVIYFADDDNTYSLDIFDEMRNTREVSVWPVGLVGGLMVEKPLLDSKTGKVIGFNSAWRPDRPFAIDMAGFAININLILQNTKAEFTYSAYAGFQESVLLQQLTHRDRLEPLASNCTKVLVWHTRTSTPVLSEELRLKKLGTSSNKGMEV